MIKKMTRGLSPKNPYIDFLSDSLWGGGNPERYSSSSPLYISRYKGPRSNPDMTHHDFWEFTCVLSGKMTFLCGDKKHVLSEGSVCLLPPLMKHREESQENPETIWIAFTGNALDKEPFTNATFAHSENLIEKSREIWLMAQKGHSRIGADLDGALLSFIGHYIRCRNNREDNDELDVVDKAIIMINDRFGEELSISDIARELNISVGYFHRAFRKRTGHAPHDYLHHMRISRAANLLLQSNLPLSRISQICGYKDPLYFSRAFKKTKKISPSEFRSYKTDKK